MKTRNGFVSNSSSSSFIVAFPKKKAPPEDRYDKFIFDDEIASFLGHEKTNDPEQEWEQAVECYLVAKKINEQQFAHFEYSGKQLRALRDKHKRDIARMFTAICGMSLYDKYKAYNERNDAKHKTLMRKIKAETNVMAKAELQKFKAKHPDCWFLIFTYSDSGKVEGHMHEKMWELARQGKAVIEDNH